MLCAICQQNRWRTNGVLTDKCCSCGFVKAKDQYFLGDFNKIYSDQYYQLGDYYNYRDEEQALKRNFRNRLNKIRSYKNSGNLLDIGCGYGLFLEEAKTYYNVLGVERNPELAEKISGRLNLPVKGGDFSKTFFDKNFDVITAFDVVEHVPDPRIFVQKCRQINNDGGMLFLETGDINSVLATIQKESWRLVNPPEHLNYFSVKTLTTLLEKSGYEVIFVERVNFWRSLRQIVFRGLHLSAKLIPYVPNVTIPLNTLDIIFIGARTKN